MKVYKFEVDDYEFTMIVDKDNIRLDITTPKSFPFPENTLNFKNDNGDSPIKDRSGCSLEEIAKELANPPKNSNKDLWWQEYKLEHKQQYLDEMTTALNKTFNSNFKIVEQ